MFSFLFWHLLPNQITFISMITLHLEGTLSLGNPFLFNRLPIVYTRIRFTIFWHQSLCHTPIVTTIEGIPSHSF